MKRQTIEVATHGGWKQTVENALVYGPFAVHQARPDSTGFTVTHLPTGFACGKDAPTEALALTLARRLVATRLPWSFTNPESRQCRRICKKASPVVKQWNAEIETVASGRARTKARINPQPSPRRKTGSASTKNVRRSQPR